MHFVDFLLFKHKALSLQQCKALSGRITFLSFLRIKFFQLLLCVPLIYIFVFDHFSLLWNKNVKNDLLIIKYHLS